MHAPTSVSGGGKLVLDGVSKRESELLEAEGIAMRKSYEALLERIYKCNSIQRDEIISSVERIHGDHRDFYPLVAMIKSGYIGFTGAAPPESAEHRDVLIAQTLQAHSQGPAPQQYKNVTIFQGSNPEHEYFFIGPRGIEYFATRSSDRKKMLASAGLSFFAAVTVAVINYWLKGGGGV